MRNCELSEDFAASSLNRVELIPSIGVKRLDWDSAFFGCEVGMVHWSLELKERITNEQEFDLIYVYSSDPLGLGDQKGYPYHMELVDHKLVLECPIEDFQMSGVSNLRVEEWRESEISKELYELAIMSGEHSRFRVDPYLPLASFEGLYRKWIESSLQSKDEVVLVHRQNELVRGMISLNCANETGTIELMAVHPDCRGQQLGQALIETAYQWQKEQGSRLLKVTTQNSNEGAVKFYKRFGYKTESLTYLYHFWRKDFVEKTGKKV